MQLETAHSACSSQVRRAFVKTCVLGLLSLVATILLLLVSSQLAGAQGYSPSAINDSSFSRPEGVCTVDDFAWVVNYLGNSISKIDTTTGAVTVLNDSTFHRPDAIACDGTDVWVASSTGGPSSNGSVEEIDASTDVVTEIDDPSFTGPNAITSDGTDVWVTNSFSPIVQEIDTATQTVSQVDTVPSLFEPVDIASNGTDVFIDDLGPFGSGSIDELDIATSNVTELTDSSAVANPTSMALDGSDLWVDYETTWGQNAGVGTLADIDLSTSNFTLYTSTSFGYVKSISSDGSAIWVANSIGGTDSQGLVTEFVKATGQIVSVNDASFDSPWAVDADGTHVWVANYQGGNGGTGSVTELDDIAPPGAPSDVTATPTYQGADLSWTAPSFTGTSPITGYVVSATDNSDSSGDVTDACPASDTSPTPSCLVTGLNLNDDYTFSVTTISAAGDSDPTTATSDYDASSLEFDVPTASSADSTDIWTVNLLGGANGHGYLTEVDQSTGQVVSIISDPSIAQSTAVANDGTDVWVAGFNNGPNDTGSVSEFNATTGAFVRQITDPSICFPEGITSNGTYVFVSNSCGGPDSLGSVSMIDIATGVVTEIDDPSFNTPGQLTSDANDVWVLNTGSVTEINIASCASTCTITPMTGSSSDFFQPDAITSNGTDVFVANRTLSGTGFVTEINAATNTVIGEISNTAFDYGISIASDADYVWVEANGAIARLDIATGAVAHVPGTYGDVSSLTISGSNVWATNDSGGPANLGQIEEIPTVNPPAAPTGLEATATFAASSSAVELSWTAPDTDGYNAITGYAVDATDVTSSSGDVTDACPSSDTSSSTSCSVTGLAVGDDYTFTVTALSGAGASAASDPSNEVNVFDDSSAYQTPVGVVTTGSQVWTANVYGGTNDLGSVTVENVADGSLTQIDSSDFYYPQAIESRQNEIWVLNLSGGAYNNGSVTEIDDVTGQVVASYSSPYFDQPVAITSDGTDIWVWNSAGGVDDMGSITEIDILTGASNEIDSSTFDGSGSVASIWSDGTDVWLSEFQGGELQTGSVNELDIATGTVNEVDPGTFLSPSGIVSDGTNVWVADSNGGLNSTGALMQIDIATGVVTEIDDPSFSFPSSLAMDDHNVWVANLGGGPGDSGSVTQYDTDSGVATEIDNDLFDLPISISSDGFNVYILNQDGPLTQIPAYSAPTAPSDAVATFSVGTVGLSWTAPESDNGSTIQGYLVDAFDLTNSANDVVDACPGTEWTAVGNAVSCEPNGIVSGDSYYFEVAAINSAGPGGFSAPSNTVSTATPPTAPSNAVATFSVGTVGLSWTAPESDNGSTIQAYLVDAYDVTNSDNDVVDACPGTEWTAVGNAVSCEPNGIVSGDSYYFEVAAVNSVGTGTFSAASNTVSTASSSGGQTPATAPGVPSAPSATIDGSTVDVDWSAPTSDGGSAITGYTVSATDATNAANSIADACPGSASSTATSCEVTGLTKGDEYTFSEAAINSVGEGGFSAASSAVTLLISPAVPTITNIPSAAHDGESFDASVATSSNGTQVIDSTTPLVCTVTSNTVNLVAPGTCTLVAHVDASATYASADGTAQSFTVAPSSQLEVSVSLVTTGTINAGQSVTFRIKITNGGPDEASGVTVDTGSSNDLDGLTSGSVSTGSSSAVSWKVGNLASGSSAAESITATVSAAGTFSLGATASSSTYEMNATLSDSKSASAQRTAPTLPTISNLPTDAVAGGSFVAVVATNGDGTKSLNSSTTSVCTVSGLTVSYLSAGTCTLISGVDAGSVYARATGSEQSFTIAAAKTTAAPSGATTTGTSTTTTTTTGSGPSDTTTTTQNGSGSSDSSTTTGSSSESATTTTTTTVRPPSVAIAFCGAPGTPLKHCRISILGNGLAPNSLVTMVVHSTPVKLGTATVQPDGTFKIAGALPSNLPVGVHHIIITGMNADGTTYSEEEVFTVIAGEKLGSVGTIPPPPLVGLVQYVPAEHRSSVLATTAGATVTVAAVASGLAGGFTIGGGRAGGGLGGPGGSGGGRSGGGLEDVELEREEDEDESEERGDKAGPWRLPGTRLLDRHSKLLPHKVAQISPVVGRVLIDGDYLRAMFGSIWLLMCAGALALGIFASSSTGWYAVPPTLGVFLTILGVSIFDSTLGFIAGNTFLACALVTGHLTSATEIRLSFGIVLVWFAVPLAAAALRPLRRRISMDPDRIWERMADLVVCGLFGMWVAEKMTSALSDLAGVELPIATHVREITFAVLLFICARIVVETFTAHFYPQRLKVVHHEGELESGKVQLLISLVVQIAVFIFFSISLLGSTWALYLGTAVFFTPIALGLIDDKIPKSELVSKLKPNGVVTWSIVIVSGVVIGSLINHLVHSSNLVVDIGFVILPVPVLAFWTLELFEEEEEEEREEYQEAEDGEEPAESSQHVEHQELDQSGAPSAPSDEVATQVDSKANAVRKWAIRLGGVVLVIISVIMVNIHT